MPRLIEIHSCGECPHRIRIPGHTRWGCNLRSEFDHFQELHLDLHIPDECPLPKPESFTPVAKLPQDRDGGC